MKKLILGLFLISVSPAFAGITMAECIAKDLNVISHQRQVQVSGDISYSIDVKEDGLVTYKSILMSEQDLRRATILDANKNGYQFLGCLTNNYL